MPPITTVSQEAVDVASEQTTLLSLMLSLSSVAQISLNSVEYGDLYMSHS